MRTLDPASTQLDWVIRSFYRMLEHDNTKKLLSLESYQEQYLVHFPTDGDIMLEANRLEVENERRFAVQLESGLLQGVIDRLILVYEGDRLVAADIIDFKTDSVADGELPSKVEYYRPQMDGYQLAVSKFLKLKPQQISTRLMFVESGQLVNLDVIETSITPDAAHRLPPPQRSKPVRTPNVAKPPATRSSNLQSKDQQQTLWPDD